MEEEFEVTYLVKEIPEGLFEITKKLPVTGTDSSHQIENTIPLTEDEYQTLASVEGKKVRKIRYFYIKENVQYEVDVFQDALEGLIAVDVEFKNKEEMSAFVAPDWFLADITQEKFIAGGFVAGKVYDDLKDDLDRFGYKKL